MMGKLWLLLLCCITQAQNVELTPGVILKSSASRSEVLYYEIGLKGETTPLVITVTPLGSGDPDLFVSLTEQHPAYNNTEHKSQQLGEDSVTISPDLFAGHNMAYIAVRAWTAGNQSTVPFSIVASFGEVALLNGIPSNGEASATKPARYTFLVPDGFNGEILITATAIQGNVLVYVSGSQPPMASDKTTFDWSATMFSGSLKVRTSDAKFPTNRKLFIGVFALERAVFSIVSTTSNQGTKLLDGVPRSSHIDVRPQEYFVFDVDRSSCNLTIVVTPMSGDPDLFVSRHDPHPSTNNSDYFSIKFGGDTIVIPNALLGPYYISVESMVVNGHWWNSSFTVTASLRCPGDQHQGFSYLIDGMPQDGFLTTAQTVFYKFAVADQHSDVTFSVYRRFGDPDLYIRNDGKFWDGMNVTDAQWSSTAKGEDIITIHQNDAGFCRHCEYSLTVLGITNTSYTIQARSSAGISTLVEGQPITEDLRGGESEYFQFTMDKSGAALTISVTDLGRGDPDLFVSKTVTKPSASNYTWAAQTIRGDSITIPFTDPEACALCTYYIAVTAFTNTTFTLVASFSDTVALADGIPQTGHAAKGAFRYYTFQTHSDLSISLTTLSGQQSLYVSTTVLPELNSRTYQWYEPWFSAVKTISISASHEHACKNASCHYSIGVYAGANGTFTITASTAEATKPLQNGIPTKDSVTAKEWKYFTFKIESAGLDFSIILTPISGDPDLYVSIRQQPNASVYDKSSIRTGDDIVDFDNAPLGLYHIGVTTSSQNASFSITVMTTDHNATSKTSDITTLLTGFPQAGITYHGRFRYYKYILENTVGELTFSCTKTFGDPDLYVNENNTLPTREFHDRSSMALAADIITIKNPKLGTYIVGVYGFSTSGYSLTVSTDDGHVGNLQASVPLRGLLAAHTWRYYLFNLDSPKDLTVSVTPFDGDPDLYISTDTYPNNTNSMWKAIAYRGDSITISKTDPKFCVCKYYIGVFSYAPTTYTIVADFGGQTRLAEGNPQTGQVAAGEITYYEARLMRNVAVTFTVTPINGDIEVLVAANRKPVVGEATWRDMSPHSGAKVRIEPSDAFYCWEANCTYFVGVSGKEGSNFTVLMTTPGSHVQLQDGIPVQTYLTKNDYGKFLFGSEQPGVEVTFVLTTLSGDADLFIHDDHFPNKTDSKFSSTIPGSDVISIQNTKPTTYFISVFAFSNSTFTMTAYVQSANSSQTTMLVGGVPQNGIVVARKYKYYHFHVSGKHANLEISVSRFVGDPDLYVTNNGSDPTISVYQWKSAMFGKDIIDIANPEPGDYKIGVFAFTTCSFSIVASTTDTVEILSDGVSFMKDLSAHEWEYFRLPVDTTDKDLTVTVTPYGNGDPDLYISDTYAFPNMTNARWKSANFREDSITIPSSDLKAQTYYVGVNAFLNVTFSIVASLSNTVRMQDGSAQAGEVANGAVKYYMIDVQEGTSALTFTLTPIVGRAFLYIAPREKPNPENHSSYRWSSFDDGIQSVTVKPMSAGFCTNCAYYIAVKGIVNITRFSILASSSVAIISLQDGIGATGSVDEKQWLYYSFVLDNRNADLTVTVTPLSGDPDLYMSLDVQKPSLTNFTIKSTAFGADIIHIDPTSPHYRLGVYYFGVTGFRNASFSIMAKVTDLSSTVGKDQQVLLREGLPQIGFLPTANSFALFTFSPSDPKRSVTFTVTPRYGDPDLFVSDTGNISNPKWSSKQWGQDSVTISDGCQKQTSCTYTIQVKAISSTLFSIVGSTGVTRLQQGVPLMANIDPNTYQHYLFHVDRTDGDVVVSLTAMTGDPDLFLAYNFSKPNKTHYEWRSMAFGSDVIVISDPSLGDYYIGVYAAVLSTYTITATVGALELVPGQPHRDKVLKNKIRQYIVQVQSQPGDLEISLDTSTGDAEILVNNNPTGSAVRWPTLTDRTWSSENRTDSARRGAVTILATDRRACFACTYAIGVYGVRDASFSLVVRYGAIGTLLESGHPVTATVDQGSSAYFRAFVNTKENDIQITSTTFVGDASVYVSMTESQPSASSYTWKSDSMKDSNHITILKTDTAFVPGTFFIGVHGVKKSTFSLSVTTRSVMLRDGVPQSGQCKSGGAFFFLYVDSAEGDVTFTLSGVDYAATAGFGLFVHTETQFNEPSSAHYLWKKDPILEGQSLVVSARDPRHCQRCTYFIGVHGSAAQEQEAARFMLRASTESAYEILLDDKMVTGTLDSKEWKYYEMYVSNARALSLVLETCVGSADMYVAQDNYAPSQEKYRWHPDAPDKVDTLVIKDGVISGASFFIGVYASLNNTAYRLRVSTTLPQDSLQPGDEGMISVATPKTGTVQLTFTPATSPRSGAKKYSVFYSEKGSDVVMYSACGLKRATLAESIQTDSIQPIVRIVDGLKADVGYRFNILVEDTDGSQAVYNYVGPVFAPSFLELEGVSMGTILGFAIPAVVLVCALVLILAIKNRKMTQELSIEMQGVPGAVLRKAMRGPRGGDDGKPRGAEKKKYTSLLTTDEGLDDDDEEEAIGFYQS